MPFPLGRPSHRLIHAAQNCGAFVFKNLQACLDLSVLLMQVREPRFGVLDVALERGLTFLNRAFELDRVRLQRR
jgi:hypothetical protein